MDYVGPREEDNLHKHPDARSCQWGVPWLLADLALRGALPPAQHRSCNGDDLGVCNDYYQWNIFRTISLLRPLAGLGLIEFFL
jgi:hypothetical protein